MKHVKSLIFRAREHPYLFLAYFSVILLALFCRMYVWWNYGDMQWDEAAHVGGGLFVSRLLLSGLNDPYGFASKYITDYPATLEGFWFYPPGYGMPTSILFLLFGSTASVARLLSLVFSMLLIHSTVQVGKEISPDEKTAILCSFLIATSSIVVIVGSGAMLDIPQTVLVMYSTMFWLRGMKSENGRDFWKAGVTAGLAGLIKPSGIFILVFVAAFQLFALILARDKLFLSRKFWVGIIVGLVVFSVWWGSALVVKFIVGGNVGDAAWGGVLYWFDLFGIFGRYVPPWYSPQWSAYEGWTYYASSLGFMMGVLPFLFSFVGICFRVKDAKRADVFLILLAIGTYVLQSFASNKNPRYILTCLPILCVYSSVGLVTTCKHISERSRSDRGIDLRKTVALFLVLVFVAESTLPLQSALRIEYLPGMGFGAYMPMQESIRIIENDGGGGIIIPDSEDNYLNVFTLTFYVAPVDTGRQYACHSPPRRAEDIFTLKIGDKGVKYIVVHDSTSAIARLIRSNPQSFTFLGWAQSTDGCYSVYRMNGA